MSTLSKINPVKTIATVKDGKINWVAQPKKGITKSLERFSKAIGERCIEVIITPALPR